MKTSQERILTTHVGSLPRSDAVLHLLEARENRRAFDAVAFDRGIRQAVLDIVKRQVDAGIDIVSDGETSKISYATYVHDRLTGFSDEGSTEGAKPHADLAPFPDLRRKMAQLSGARRFKRVACVGPIAVRNREALDARPRQYARRRRYDAAGRGIFDHGLSGRGRELSAEHLLSQPRGLYRGHRRGDAGRVRRHCGSGLRAANRLSRSGDVAAYGVPGPFGAGVLEARRLPCRSAQPCARQYSAQHGPHPCVLGQLRRPAHPRHRARQDHQDRSWRKRRKPSRSRPQIRVMPTNGPFGGNSSFPTTSCCYPA